MALQETAEFILSMHKFRSAMPENIRPSWVKLTTITMLSKFDCELDVERIEKAFRILKRIKVSSATNPVRVRTVVKGGKVEVKCETGGNEWRRKYTTFYNQVSLTYMDCYSNKSVKIFPNGSVHVTGCTTIFECEDVMLQVKAIFDLIFKWTTPVTYTRPRILMINSNYSLNYFVNQYEIIERLKRNKMFKISFTPEKYSAINVKFKPLPDMKQVTVNIFGTGNIIINGAVTLKEIAYAYKVINQYLTADIREDKADVVKTHDMFLGAKLDRWVQVLKKVKLYDAYE